MTTQQLMDERVKDEEQPGDSPGISEIARYFHYKAWVDRPFAAVLLVISSPLLLVLMGLVRATSRGPAIYCQKRTGRDNRDFMMYKLRTMQVDAEMYTGAIWSTRDDPRITPVGRVLRFLHLDELPQLVNVARGEMAFVGPRPERPCIIAQLEKQIPNYRDRHAVVPGITGLAQINLPPDTSVECVRKKLQLDMELIELNSFWLEGRILCCTLLRMMGLRHGRAVRLFLLERLPSGGSKSGLRVDSRHEGDEATEPFLPGEAGGELPRAHSETVRARPR